MNQYLRLGFRRRTFSCGFSLIHWESGSQNRSRSGKAEGFCCLEWMGVFVYGTRIVGTDYHQQVGFFF